MTWISLFPLFQFTPTSFFPCSHSLHIPFPSVSLVQFDVNWKEQRTFLLKLLLFFLFSFTHLVLLFVSLYSISDGFTLIHFLLFLSLSLTFLSHTHTRARAHVSVHSSYIGTFSYEMNQLFVC